MFYLADFSNNWLKKVGDNPLGKVFLKDAQKVTRVLPNNKGIINTFGIANSGKTIRKTPLALGALGVTGYAGYKAKKKYDQYKPEIKTGMKFARIYNDFKNKFGEN
jgi:hypothetical protein